jgi:hypothetical protein
MQGTERLGRSTLESGLRNRDANAWRLNWNVQHCHASLQRRQDYLSSIPINYKNGKFQTVARC